MKYFKDCKTLKELKDTYKKLLKENHPDNGGDLEVMKEINVQFDSVFPILRDQAAKEAAEPEEVKKETAETVRKDFYTANGWVGSNYDFNLSLKEIAKIVRGYIKEKYPTYKFSVRTSYGSMCQTLRVDMKESPIEIYKTLDEITEEEKYKFISKAAHNGYWNLDSWNDSDFEREYKKITAEHGNFYKVMNEVTKSIVADVDNFVKSYNMEDIDGMIDYFHVNFYYFGCCENNGMHVKNVPKTARIKNKKATPATKKRQTKKEQKEVKQIEKVTKVTYKITKGEDTRDMSDLWVVRINESLNKEEYIDQNKKMRDLGGYYSKFKHGFIFRYDPSGKLA